MILTTRFWGGTTILLCALLWQSCQSSSLRVTEEEESAAASSSASAMRQRASSEPSAAQSLTSPSASPAAHAPPSRSSTTPANENDFSTAPSSCPLSPSASYTFTTVGNSPTASHDLQPTAIPRDSHEEEESKPPAKRQFSNLDNELAKGNKQARDGERWEQGCICRDTLSTLLAMAVSAPDKAAKFLEVSLAAVQDKHFRQQALEALGKVAKAPPDMFSECLPSLRAAAKEGEDKAVRLLALRTLGEAEWEHYFGDVGVAPALPNNMTISLDSACPICPGKKIRDTHLLVLIPATVDGAPFTLNLLGELIRRPRNGGNETKYRYYSNIVKAQLGEASPDRSYWLLMTRDVLENSRSKVYAAQRALVASHAGRTGQPYEIPGALEAATSILMHHVRTGERLFGDTPWTYAHCQEVINNRHGVRYPNFVGGFESSGLFVSEVFVGAHKNEGVAGCQKFF
jgi:hypothetical protein